MSELIKAAVSIKDPFTLVAFLALLLLIAFRTKSVPAALFKLVGAKMTREHFSQLMHRTFLYMFLAFVVLCGLAVLGQVLGYMTSAKAATVDELKRELALRETDESAARKAIQEYQRGLAQAEDQKLSDAIASLESSLKAVPTAAAQETLALLYQKAGDNRRAIQLAGQAVSTARESGNAVRTAKAERVLNKVSGAISAPVSVSTSCPSNAGLIGPKLDLPPGGDSFESALLLVPCVYKGILDTQNEQWKYYKVSVPRGQPCRSSCGRGTQMRLQPIFGCTDRMVEPWVDIPPTVTVASPNPLSTRPTILPSFLSVSRAVYVIRRLKYRSDRTVLVIGTSVVPSGLVPSLPDVPRTNVRG